MERDLNDDDENITNQTNRLQDVSKIKEWVSLKLKELEDQNFTLKKENRKFTEELAKLKQCYVKKSFTPEVHRKFNKRDLYQDRLNKYDLTKDSSSSSSDDEFFVIKSKHNVSLKQTKMNKEKLNRPKIDGTNIKLLSGNSRPICASRSGSLDRKLTRMKKLNFNELRKQQKEKMFQKDYYDTLNGRKNSLEKQDFHKPPTPPLHRFPSWESRIYEIANNGIKSTISTPVQQVKQFDCSKIGDSSISDYSSNFPIFKNVNGRLTKIPLNSFNDESMFFDFEDDLKSVNYFKSSTTSSGNESDYTNELKLFRPGFNSDSSEDYAYPPDVLTPMDSLNIVEETFINSTNNKNNQSLSELFQFNENQLEKSGYLLKLSKRLKTWKRRWFVLKDGSLIYYKNQDDYLKNKSKEQIVLDQYCKLIRSNDCRFHLSYKNDKRSIHLLADCPETYDEWIRTISQSLTYNNIIKLQENQAPIIKNYLTKVRFGRALKCWTVLYDQYLFYFKTPEDKTPMGYTNLKDAKLQEINSLTNVEDLIFASEETKKNSNFSISIHSSDNIEPIYLLFSTKQELTLWYHHLKTSSSGNRFLKTVFENFIDLLTSTESSCSSIEEFYKHQLWNNEAILFTNKNIFEPLTSLPNDTLKAEAVKLFKSIQLFISIPIDFSAIDYHVILIQNSFKVCLDNPELQSELYYQLIKLSTPEIKNKEFLKSYGIHRMFFCSPNSIFKCESSSCEITSPTLSESSQYDLSMKHLSTIFLQCFKLLAITISIFYPKNSVLWILKHHLNRSKDSKTELGKYAFYCERALERILLTGDRKQIPSRMEVLSILQRNPFDHSMPHSIPVHFANNSYQVIGFDGSTTISEFIQQINAESGIRENVYSGFALYSDDPIDENTEHLLNLNCKLADIISHWETKLRKYRLGKFENTKVIKLIYKHRLCLKKYYKNETDKERLLWVYEINREIINAKFPITFDLAIELMTLLMQIEYGDFQSVANFEQICEHALEQYLPSNFREVSSLKQLLLKRWAELRSRSSLDCVRIYLNCTRKWDLCGCRIFNATVSNSFKYDDFTSMQLCKMFTQCTNVWIAVTEDVIELLETDSFRSILRIPHKSIVNFGGFKSYFMIIVNGNMLEKFVPNSESSIPFSSVKSLHGQRLLFSMPKKKIIDITMLLADYINISTYKLTTDV